MPEKNIPILVKNDRWLAPYTDEINSRTARYEARRKELEKKYGSLSKFAEGYNYLGLNFSKKENGWWYREWAPNALELYLTGEFNDWNKASHPLKKEHT